MSERFESHNRSRRGHRLAQVVLWLALIVGLNLLGMRIYSRVDLSERHQLSLSSESAAYLTTLEGPIRIAVAMPDDSEDPDVRLLITAMRDLTRALSAEAADIDLDLTVEWVDVLQDFDRAQELAETASLTQPNSVVVSAGTRQRLLLPPDLLVFEDQRPVAFSGEAALLQAMLEVAGQDAPVIYFTAGHGEMSLEDVSAQRGLSLLQQELTRRHVETRPLRLAERDAVPDDAAAVVIAEPLGPFLPSEVAALQSYLEDRAGQVLIFLGPRHDHGLEALLFAWGLRSDDMAVLEQGRDYLGGPGTYLIRQIAPHTLTAALVDNQAFMIGSLARPVRPDPGAPLDQNREITPLFGSSPTSWAESNYAREQVPSYHEASDLPGPVILAATVTRTTSAQLGITLPTGRLTAVGVPDLFANGRLPQLGNSAFFVSWLNDALDRQMPTTLAAQPFERISLTLSRAQKQQLALALFALPVGVLLLGLGSLLWRRVT